MSHGLQSLLALVLMGISCLAGGQTRGPENHLLGEPPFWQHLCVAMQCCVMVWGDGKEHQRSCVEVEGEKQGKRSR